MVTQITNFQGQSLPTLLLNIVSKQIPGQLQLSSTTSNAIIYFGVGRILAAIAEPFKGVPAIRSILTWESGQGEFVHEMVLLSSLPRESWVRPSLDEVLIELSEIKIVTENQSLTIGNVRVVPQSSPKLMQKPSRPVPAALIDELERILKQLVGPFGGVLLEDAAENIGSEIDSLTSANVQAWLIELRKLVPAERKQAFEARVADLLKNI